MLPWASHFVSSFLTLSLQNDGFTTSDFRLTKTTVHVSHIRAKSWSNTVHPKTSDIRIMIIRIWPLHDTSDITRTTLGSHWLRGWFPLLPHHLKTIVPCDPALWPLGRLQQHRADQAGVPLAARFLPLPWEVMKQRLLLGETTAKGKYWNKMN